MKKILVMLFLLFMLFVSVMPASAKFERGWWITSVRKDTRTVCFLVGFWDEWCAYVAEDAHIHVPGIPGSASFDDLNPGQWAQVNAPVIDNSIPGGITSISVIRPYTPDDW